jgi:hypothetical protein
MSSEVPPGPPSDVPEIKREPRGLPWLGIVVVAILGLAGMALVGFALFVGQGEAENRAISGTVAAVQAFTRAPTNTPLPQPTSVPAMNTSEPSPVPPTDTAVPSTEAAITAPTVPPTLPPTTKPIVLPTDTPPPPPTATFTPAPQPSGRGLLGELLLCNPEKPSFAANIERICFREKIVNTTNGPITYGILGVQAANLSGGANKFQTSWAGDLSIGAGCTGPTDSCGGPWEDGMYLEAGTYHLSLSICYSKLDVCRSASGEWETLTPGVTVNVVNWTPSP